MANALQTANIDIAKKTLALVSERFALKVITGFLVIVIMLLSILNIYSYTQVKSDGWKTKKHATGMWIFSILMLITSTCIGIYVLFFRKGGKNIKNSYTEVRKAIQKWV